MTTSDPAEQGAPSGPLLGLLARALELWLRQQCQTVHELELQLEGSMAQLLRGHLQGVRLRARGVEYQSLSLDQVELRSGPIQVRVGGVLRGQSLRLEHPFRVRGSVALTGEGLSRSLATPQWRCLGDQLGEGLLGVTPLAGVKVREEILILWASAGEGAVEVESRMVLTAEGLELRPLNGAPPLSLPMDPAICLERADVRANRLELIGEALVRP